MQSTRALIYILVRISFALLAGYALLRGDYEQAAIASIGLVLSFVPQLIVRRLGLKLPLLYELVVLIFIVASIMLGEFFRAYDRFWWWDSVLHLSSGLIIGYIGYMLLYTFRMQGKLNISAAMVAFLTFSVSMMVAAMWEVFEFTVDEVFGATMQHGNTDTMMDMILAMVGSLVATVVAYWHTRWPDSSPLRKEFGVFMKRNIHLIPKRRRERVHKELPDDI